MAKTKKTRKSVRQPVRDQPGEMREIEVAELAAARDAGDVGLLLDVRTGLEFGGGHVPGAKNIPLSRLDVEIRGLSKAAEVYLICKSGNRSSTAARIMADAGFRVVNVRGGTVAWTSAGHAVDPPSSSVSLWMPLLASLTLGLAPFSPEPHLVGKLRWIAGGAAGMTAMDWGDLAMHGAPFLWLAWALVVWLRAKSKDIS